MVEYRKSRGKKNREKALSPNIEYFDNNGRVISADEFDKRGGVFSTSINGVNGRRYNIAGKVVKKGKKWVAEAEVEQVK